MNIAQARQLAQQLSQAADRAQAQGKAEVDLPNALDALRQLDDAARAELAAAIAATE